MFGATGNGIYSNVIGSNTQNAANAANGNGIELTGAASGNTIGKAINAGTVSAFAGNVISNNKTNGIWIAGTASTNVVQNNYIGTNLAGTAQAGSNQPYGVDIQGSFDPSTGLGSFPWPIPLARGMSFPATRIMEYMFNKAD